MDSKIPDIKKNHHYIWSFYLWQWSNNNNIFYTTEREKIAYNSIKGVAVEKNFYKIHPLDSTDVYIIDHFIKEHPKEYQYFNYGILSHFINISEKIEKSRIEPSVSSYEEALMHNSLEDLYSNTENSVKEIFKELYKMNINVLDSVINKACFFGFLGAQEFRTPHIKDSIFGYDFEPFNNGAEGIEETYNAVKKNWWIIAKIKGFNEGIEFIKSVDKRHVAIIENKTSTPFITGDRPVVRLGVKSKDGSYSYTDKEGVGIGDFYFPISPTKAILVCGDNENMNIITDVRKNAKLIDKLNYGLAKQSIYKIYANSKEVIEGVMANRA